MFQQANPEYRNSNSYLHLQNTHGQLDSSLQRDPSLRKRLHQLMSETFELKETISTLQTELKRAVQEQQELKAKLREALEQITANDCIMEECRCRQAEQRQAAMRVREQLEEVRGELQGERGAVRELGEHNRSLQTQNRLLAQIKQKYQTDLSRAKLQLEHFRNECERLMILNQDVMRENQSMSGEVEMLRQQVSSRRRQIQQYQTFVLERISAAKNSPQFHSECVQQRDRLYCKYLKYKQRSRMALRQRDQLLFHLSEVSREVQGGSSGR